MKWWDQRPWSLFFKYWVFKPVFSIKRIFNSFLLFAIKVLSSAYLRLLIFLPAILIPACASSRPGFHVTYSAFKLNKQGDIYSLDVLLFLFGTSLLFLMSSSNCCFLTWEQTLQEASKVVWSSHLLKNFPQFVVIHRVKGFRVVNEAVDVFLEFSHFFYDPTDIGNLISGSSAFSKSSLYIWKFSVHILLKPRLKDFELACEMS